MNHSHSDKKKSLIALSQEMATFEQKVIENEGELDEALEAELAQISANLVAKVDAYKWRIDRLESLIEFWKQQEDQASITRESLQRHKKAMEARIKEAMVTMKVAEVKGEKFAFSLSNSRPRLVVDESKLPKQYFIRITEQKPDSERIREDLENGKVVDGASLEQSFALRKKVNKEL